MTIHPNLNLNFKLLLMYLISNRDSVHTVSQCPWDLLIIITTTYALLIVVIVISINIVQWLDDKNGGVDRYTNDNDNWYRIHKIAFKISSPHDSQTHPAGSENEVSPVQSPEDVAVILVGWMLLLLSHPLWFLRQQEMSWIIARMFLLYQDRHKRRCPA